MAGLARHAPAHIFGLTTSIAYSFHSESKLNLAWTSRSKSCRCSNIVLQEFCILNDLTLEICKMLDVLERILMRPDHVADTPLYLYATGHRSLCHRHLFPLVLFDE